MTELQDVSSSLPLELQDSNLSWTPFHDDQAPAPRPGDGWLAKHPSARVEIKVENNYSVLYYTLLITHAHTQQQITYAEFENLLQTVNYAEKCLEKTFKPTFKVLRGGL